MKKTRAKDKTPGHAGQTHDIAIANRMSGKLHNGLSRIRLSLTFRIALHYCFQLFRSVIPVCIIFSVVFCLAIGMPLSAKLDTINRTNRQEENPVYQNEWLTVAKTEQQAEKDFFPRLSQQAKSIFSGLFQKHRLSFFYTSHSGEWLVTVVLSDLFHVWLLLMGGIVLTDVFRMVYFFRHDQRLNRRVLAPIRDIASMAATLSENNLSNRINIAGTKNELKDLATVINTMLDRIERSYNSQKQFVSDASHELRTPIAVIRGYTDMLRRWGKDDPDILDEGITAISQETEGMKDLVESLLFLARHDKKTLMMEISDFDISELIRETRKEESMVHKNHQFALECADPIILKADRNMIKQVVRILCDNAVKYSPEGTTVTLSCASDSAGCIISVRDEGPGIASEDLPKIFDRFYRSDKARKADTAGHGLGLSIARIIVVAHGGKIRVRSKPGSGSVFSVILPLSENAGIT